MVIDMGDVFDGAIEGEVILESRKAEEKTFGNYEVIDIMYVVVDSEPQGDRGLSANGEIINHTVWLPMDTDDDEAKTRKIKGLKRFLEGHGIATDGPINTKEIVDYFNTNRVQVGASCTLDKWREENRDEVVTKIKKFYMVN